MVPALVLAVPLFDTSLVIISRLRRHLNPLTTPGKDHLSHRLARLTGSPREAVLICYLLAGLAGVLATFVTQASLSKVMSRALPCWRRGCTASGGWRRLFAEQMKPTIRSTLMRNVPNRNGRRCISAVIPVYW